MTEEERLRLALIEELAEIITLLADKTGDSTADYVANRYLYDLYTKYGE